jgi:hypothetical protein
MNQGAGGCPGGGRVKNQQVQIKTGSVKNARGVELLAISYGLASSSILRPLSLSLSLSLALSQLNLFVILMLLDWMVKSNITSIALTILQFMLKEIFLFLFFENFPWEAITIRL